MTHSTKMIIRIRVWAAVFLFLSGLLASTRAYGQVQPQELTLKQCDEWLKSESLDFRLLAVDQAMKYKDTQRQEMLSVLHKALKDPNNIVRIVVARNLQRLKDAASISPLIAALGEKDALIDNNEMYSGIFAGGSLAPQFRGKYYWRGDVIDTLGEYGNDAAAALPLVRRYIAFDYSMPVACSAVRFVGLLRDKESLDVLTNLVTSKANIWWLVDAKRSAVEALGRIADPRSASVLEECVRTSGDQRLRDAAKEALAKIQVKSR